MEKIQNENQASPLHTSTIDDFLFRPSKNLLKIKKKLLQYSYPEVVYVQAPKCGLSPV